MNNVIIAAQLAAQLLAQLQNINSLTLTAQQSGTDISSDQLNTLSGDYGTAKAQLDADIAAAKVAGK